MDKREESEKGKMGIKEIMGILPHRYPFILIDKVTNLEPGSKITGYKNVSINEQFFQGHFPNNPVMPGVLILEGMAQLAGILAIVTDPIDRAGKDPYLLSVDRARFRRPVEPGDRLEFHIDMLNKHKVGDNVMYKFNCTAKVEGRLACEAGLTAAFIKNSKDIPVNDRSNNDKDSGEGGDS